MDISKIIGSTEELLYEVVLWLLLIPKTIFKVITQPSWIPQYVASELRKAADDRFDSYMPPVIFFVVVAIVPNLLANVIHPDIPYNDFLTRRTVVAQTARLSEEHRFILYSLVWMFLPLSYTLLHHATASRAISRSALKPAFYAQCFRIAPVSLLFLSRFVVVLATLRTPEPGWVQPLNCVTVVLCLAWIVLSEVPVAMAELQVGRRKAFTISVMGVFVYFAFIIPLVAISAAVAGVRPNAIVAP